MAAKLGSLQHVTVATTSTVLLEQDENRTGFTVSSPIANRVTLSDKGTAVDQQGIVLFASGPPMVFCQCHHGDWVKKKITAIADTAPAIIGVQEAFARSEEGE